MTVSDAEQDLVVESSACAEVTGLPPEVAIVMNRHRRTIQDLEDSERYSRALFHAAEAGLVIVDAGTLQIMDANRAAATALRVSEDDLVGRLATHCGLGSLCDCLSTGASIVPRQELRLPMPDGSPLPVLASAMPLQLRGQSLVVISFVDISDVSAAREQLSEANGRLEAALHQVESQRDAIVQSEKMASIGQLAAGVAHEINNPIGYVSSNLATISEYVEFMRSLLAIYGRLTPLDATDPERATLLAELDATMQDEDVEFILSDIDGVLKESMEGTTRVTEIVQNLKSFAREDSAQKRPHDLNDGVESMIRMVWNELKYSCTVAKELQPLPTVHCHAGQINQVIMNMLVNAAHAMGSRGGTITVRTEARETEVMFSISDTGCGMTPEVMTHIFDPFFTTKDVGKGTGLGLSISHGIIAEHGGRIEVESAESKGSTFRVFLPLSTPEDEDLIG